MTEKSPCSNAFKHFLFSAFKIYLYLWPCLTFFTEFPFPFKKQRPRKTENELREPQQEVSWDGTVSWKILLQSLRDKYKYMLDEVFRDLQTVCISGRFQEEFLSLAGSWVSGLKLKKKSKPDHTSGKAFQKWHRREIWAWKNQLGLRKCVRCFFYMVRLVWTAQGEGTGIFSVQRRKWNLRLHSSRLHSYKNLKCLWVKWICVTCLAVLLQV